MLISRWGKNIGLDEWFDLVMGAEVLAVQAFLGGWRMGLGCVLRGSLGPAPAHGIFDGLTGVGVGYSGGEQRFVFHVV